MIPELYLHGLSEGDCACGRSRKAQADQQGYVWVDGVYVKAGFEREKSAVLVAIGALSMGVSNHWASCPVLATSHSIMEVITAMMAHMATRMKASGHPNCGAETQDRRGQALQAGVQSFRLMPARACSAWPRGHTVSLVCEYSSPSLRRQRR